MTNNYVAEAIAEYWGTRCSDYDGCPCCEAWAQYDAFAKERDAAIKALCEAATARGQAEGKLAASEMVGVVEGWKTRAKKAEAERDTMAAQYTTACQLIDKVASERDQALALLNDGDKPL